MRRPSLVIVAVVSALCLAVGLAACGSSSSSSGGSKSFDLTIGDSLPLTGDLAPFGPAGNKAAHLAVDNINKAIKTDGVKQTVTLKTQDNAGGTDPQSAVSAARKLVSDGSTCIAGAWASSDTIPTAQSVAIPQGVLLISPASTSSDITKLDDPDKPHQPDPAGRQPAGPGTRAARRALARRCQGQDGQRRRPQRLLRERPQQAVHRELGEGGRQGDAKQHRLLRPRCLEL